MSYAKKCDRCGAYFERRTGANLVITTYYGLSSAEKDIDLCDDCTIEFDEFMRGIKPKNLLERIKLMINKEK